MIGLIALILMTPMLVVILCALAYALAIYALPYKMGLAAAHFAYITGAGDAGAGLFGLVAGYVSFHILAYMFATLREPVPRMAIALVFAGPAAMAGYTWIHDVIRDSVPSLIWREIFCIAGAAFAGFSALVRLAGTSALPANCPRSLAVASSRRDSRDCETRS